jgi:hypothetical protein
MLLAYDFLSAFAQVCMHACNLVFFFGTRGVGVYVWYQNYARAMTSSQGIIIYNFVFRVCTCTYIRTHTHTHTESKGIISVNVGRKQRYYKR